MVPSTKIQANDYLQNDPDLRGRAYKAAWMVNAYTMLIMNLTRPNPHAFAYMKSKVGDKYPVTHAQTPGAKLNGIYLSGLWLGLLDPEAYLSTIRWKMRLAPTTQIHSGSLMRITAIFLSSVVEQEARTKPI